MVLEHIATDMYTSLNNIKHMLWENPINVKLPRIITKRGIGLMLCYLALLIVATNEYHKLEVNLFDKTKRYAPVKLNQ